MFLDSHQAPSSLAASTSASSSEPTASTSTSQPKKPEPEASGSGTEPSSIVKEFITVEPVPSTSKVEPAEVAEPEPKRDEVDKVKVEKEEDGNSNVCTVQTVVDLQNALKCDEDIQIVVPNELMETNEFKSFISTLNSFPLNEAAGAAGQALISPNAVPKTESASAASTPPPGPARGGAAAARPRNASRSTSTTWTTKSPFSGRRPRA